MPGRFQTFVLSVVAMSWAIGASAQENVGLKAGSGDSRTAIIPLVTFEHHGDFRFRFNTFYGLDLGMGSDTNNDPTCMPSTSSASGAEGVLGNVESAAVSANMRLRYRPTLHVGEIVKVNMIADFLDNVVMGESPDVSSIAAPMSLMARSARAPVDGWTAFQDSVAIKAAWAELNLFGILHVAGGRQPEHFGLGIVRSGGWSPDSDYGDFVDGVFAKVNLDITYLRFGMEFPGEGVTSEQTEGDTSYPYDLSTKDDVIRWVFGVDSSPVTPEDFRKRREDLVAGKPVVDWGWYNAITQQDYASDRTVATNVSQTEREPDPVTLEFDDVTVVPRSAFFWTPSIWARLKYRPHPGLTIRLEGEFAMTYGYVDFMESNIETISGSEKDFLSFGGALEAEIDFGDNKVTFLGGGASGGNTLGAWGVTDRHTLVAQNSNCFNADTAVNESVYLTKNIHNFVFNADYRIDSILFREVIGAVTNAFYFKPGYSRVFLRDGAWAFGGGLTLLAAFASIPEGTPGGKRPLGVEGGLDLFLNYGKNLTIRADADVLFPLAGLRRSDAENDPETAAAFRMRAQFRF